MRRLLAPLYKALGGIRILGWNVAFLAWQYPFRKAFAVACCAPDGRRRSLIETLRRFPRAWKERERPEPPPAEAFSHLGRVQSVSSTERYVEVHCQAGALRIIPLQPDLFCVRHSPDGKFPPAFSYSVLPKEEDWPACAFTVTEDDHSVRIATERLVCVVRREDAGVEFHDASGGLISAECEGAGAAGGWSACWRRLREGEQVYALAEKAVNPDLRGRRYRIWNQDPQNFVRGADPLYLNIPFLMGLHDGRAYGLFLDNPAPAVFDIGQARPDTLAIMAEAGELRYYFMYGPAPAVVLERFTGLTGRINLPPLWALGFHQSKWSYFPDAEVRRLAETFRRLDIPCDAIYLDIHYMDGYRNFTWHPERFPDPAGLIRYLEGMGFRLVVIIDAGIKADHRDPVCREGLERKAFITYPDGRLFKGPVWPGDCYFPDFTSPDVRAWFGEHYRPLLEMGVAGIWNDMNEPTIISLRGDAPPDIVRHTVEGRGGDHREYHNVYGLLMARASHEALMRLRPARRPFVLSRSGFAGIQRYALVWTGDNLSTWDSLALTIPMLLNLGLSGVAFAGADVGGFGEDCDGELLVRWTQLAVLTPFFRNHNYLLGRPQEPWAFGEPFTSINRSYIAMRYQFLPAIYTAFWQAAQYGWPVMRPMFWEAPELAGSPGCDDQFFCGDHLLAAPVLRPRAVGRDVHLPAGSWYDWWTDERFEGPADVRVPAPLEILPLFVRAGAVIPTAKVMPHTPPAGWEHLILHVFAGSAESVLYEDAGEGWGFRQGEFRLSRFATTWQEGVLRIRREVDGAEGIGSRRWEVVVHGLPAPAQEVLVDGQGSACAWDAEHKVLRLETAPFREIEIRV